MQQQQHPIYPNQIRASDEIRAAFATKHSYVSLIAQMQSGKTDTFLLTAFEALRTGLVQRVIIFTGNSDLVLKQQTVDSIHQFSFKYQQYLNEIHGMVIMGVEWGTLFDSLRRRIDILWSNELAKKGATGAQEAQNRDTLLIWEESHFAQSKQMRPFEFLSKCLLPSNGGDRLLKEHNNFILSVSATPFSEFAAMVIQEQEKHIVYLNPGPHYYGVAYFLSEEMLCAHENEPGEFRDALIACERQFDQPKYAIVRAMDGMARSFVSEATTRGWAIKQYNMDVQETDIHLREAPTANTIVLIKGALRMGQQVTKTHVGFCWESTSTPSTDTILQGLVGRMCSFDPCVRSIRIYLHTKIIESGELQRYVEFIDSIAQGKHINASLSLMPHNAMNLHVNNSFAMRPVVMGDRKFQPGVPIHIPAKIIRQAEGSAYGGSGSNKKKMNPLMASISSILNDVSEYPEIELTQEVASDIEERMATKKSSSQHNWGGASYTGKMRKLVRACLSRQPFRSCNDVETVQIWKVNVVKSEFPDFAVGDVILEFSFQVPELSETTTAGNNNTTGGNAVPPPPIPTHLRVDEDAAFIQKLQRLFQKKLVDTYLREHGGELTTALESYLSL